MNEYDELTLFVWNEGGTAVHDPLFLRASHIRKSSHYPAGLYGAASFVLPRNILTNPSRLRTGYEISLVDGANEVYHGYVESLEDINTSGAEGTLVNCVGAWGWFMERRGIHRNWADTRISADVWGLETDGTPDLITVRRDNGAIRIVPKAEAWVTNDFARVHYLAPTGEEVGRTSVSYDLQEAAQNWRLLLVEDPSTTLTIDTSTSGTGTNAANATAGTNEILFQLQSNANQTPTADGTYYAEISDVIIYSGRDHASATVGNVDIYEIALDIVDRLAVDETLISSDVGDLDTALTYSLVPFITNGWESYASILARAARYGSSTAKSIGFGLRPPSESPDGLPKLFIETYPAAATYEYEASVDELDLHLRLNTDSVYNYIVVGYYNLQGDLIMVTPDDDSTLKDDDSIALYGQRSPSRPLILEMGGETVAIAYGVRFLTRHKQPTYAVTRPVRVSRLRAKNGGYVPAAQIDAGQRLRITDLPDTIDLGGVGGTTLLITKTDYDHDSKMVSLALGGRPDRLDVLMAQFGLRADRLGR